MKIGLRLWPVGDWHTNRQTDRITHKYFQYTWKIFDFPSNKQGWKHKPPSTFSGRGNNLFTRDTVNKIPIDRYQKTTEHKNYEARVGVSHGVTTPGFFRPLSVQARELKQNMGQIASSRMWGTEENRVCMELSRMLEWNVEPATEHRTRTSLGIRVFMPTFHMTLDGNEAIIAFNVPRPMAVFHTEAGHRCQPRGGLNRIPVEEVLRLPLLRPTLPSSRKRTNGRTI